MRWKLKVLFRVAFRVDLFSNGTIYHRPRMVLVLTRSTQIDMYRFLSSVRPKLDTMNYSRHHTHRRIPESLNPDPVPNPNGTAIRMMMGENVKSNCGVMSFGLASQASRPNPTLPDSISIDLCFSKVVI